MAPCIEWARSCVDDPHPPNDASCCAATDESGRSLFNFKECLSLNKAKKTWLGSRAFLFCQDS